MYVDHVLLTSRRYPNPKVVPGRLTTGRKLAFIDGAAAIGTSILLVAIVVGVFPPNLNAPKITSSGAAAMAMTYYTEPPTRIYPGVPQLGKSATQIISRNDAVLVSYPTGSTSARSSPVSPGRKPSFHLS